MKGNLKDKIEAKVSKKTSNLKDRIAAKAARKAGRACVALALLAALCGCHMGELPTSQPTAQRAQTSTITDNRFDIRVIASTNAVYDAEGNPVAAVRIEIGNLTQANETSGSESQTATQTATPSNTPTVSTPVRVDARYNDAAKAAGGVLETFLASLAPDSAAELKKFVASGKDGSLTVTKTDGTTETVTCKGGVCSDSSGACLNCSD